MAEPRKPADRARKQAAAKATVGDPVRVEISGKAGTAEVTVLPMLEWGFGWASHLQRELGLHFIEDILDEDDLDAFMAVKPTVPDLTDFVRAYSEQVGVDLGESLSSQAS